MSVETREQDFAKQRERMARIITLHAGLCTEEFGTAGLSDRAMEVVARVPRHAFVPVEIESWAYEDMPLPIGYGKTMSQPFIVALMTDQLSLAHGDKVLEIGTGLGYQTAVLVTHDPLPTLCRSSTPVLQECRTHRRRPCAPQQTRPADAFGMYGSLAQTRLPFSSARRARNRHRRPVSNHPYTARAP